tara:strand:- start:460165 stop:461169 length:1005 start_codon:yes stop_codon:yes gene_type:complete
MSVEKLKQEIPEINMTNKLHYTALAWLFATLIAALATAAQAQPSYFNDFDVENSIIDPIDIYHGGPDRNGIPAIDRPLFASGEAREGLLGMDERVLAVHYNGISKAYPVAIMDHHEVVNDFFGIQAVTITFCPLCGTGMAFMANTGGKSLSFGVSGLLYNSNVLLYDRNTESLWSQVMKTAISGPMKGHRLDDIPLEHSTWGQWLKRYPDSLLLTQDTGFDRDYSADVYYDYKRLPMVYYPTVHQDLRLTAKDWVIGVTLHDSAIAIPYKELDKAESPLITRVGGREIRVEWDKKASSARVFNDDGEQIPATAGYWFAWVAFHPDTELFNASSQ